MNIELLTIFALLGVFGNYLTIAIIAQKLRKKGLI